MKTPRTSPNVSATRATEQVGNTPHLSVSRNGSKPRPALVPPRPLVPGPVGVFILDDINNSCRELARLELSAELFAHMKDVATGRKQTLGDFLASSIAMHLHYASVIDELRNSSDQAHALADLMVSQILDPVEGIPSASLKNGIVNLTLQTYSRLGRAVAAVEMPKPVGL